MNSKHLLRIVLVTFLILACRSSHNSLFEFDPRTLKGNKITLSEVAQEVAYIPLDNIVPLGLIFNINVLDSVICFCSKDIGILSFDMEGNFVRKIGSIGRGPGEYIYYSKIAVEDKKGIIYILDRGNIVKVYSATGNFIRSFSLQQYGDNIDAIGFYNSNLFITNEYFSLL